jgi:hypothetical protein
VRSHAVSAAKKDFDHGEASHGDGGAHGGPLEGQLNFFLGPIARPAMTSVQGLIDTAQSNNKSYLIFHKLCEGDL